MEETNISPSHEVIVDHILPVQNLAIQQMYLPVNF